MKNINKVSKMTQGIRSTDRTTWLPLFYSIQEDAVYTTPGNDRYEVTCLIKPNTPEDIKQAVNRFLYI